MVRSLKMAVLLLSVHPLPNQFLLHLYPMHTTDHSTTCLRPQLVIVLIKGAVRDMRLCGFPGN